MLKPPLLERALDIFHYLDSSLQSYGLFNATKPVLIRPVSKLTLSIHYAHLLARDPQLANQIFEELSREGIFARVYSGNTGLVEAVRDVLGVSDVQKRSAKLVRFVNDSLGHLPHERILEGVYCSSSSREGDIDANLWELDMNATNIRERVRVYQ